MAAESRATPTHNEQVKHATNVSKQETLSSKRMVYWHAQSSMKN